MKYIFFIFLVLSPPLFAQQKTNRYKNQQKQGLWIIYQDSTKAKIDNIGKYRNGAQKGCWKYYSANGNLITKERYIFRRSYIKEYYDNGNIKRKGQRKLIIKNNLIHYFYYGNWLYYDSLGVLTQKRFYKEGKSISETNYKSFANIASKSFNDSLDNVLKNLYKQLYKYVDSLNIADKNYGKNSKQYQYYLTLSNLNGLGILNDIDKIISRFGYPTKALVGDDNVILFSIISVSDNSFKEKYYNIIIDAADKGELDWTDVAFFVDKVNVAKKQPQTYGTQFILVNNKYKFYPIADKTHLNERRKKVKLYEVNISDIDDSAGY